MCKKIFIFICFKVKWLWIYIYIYLSWFEISWSLFCLKTVGWSRSNSRKETFKFPARLLAALLICSEKRAVYPITRTYMCKRKWSTNFRTCFLTIPWPSLLWLAYVYLLTIFYPIIYKGSPNSPIPTSEPSLIRHDLSFILLIQGVNFILYFGWSHNVLSGVCQYLSQVL